MTLDEDGGMHRDGHGTLWVSTPKREHSVTAALYEETIRNEPQPATTGTDKTAANTCSSCKYWEPPLLFDLYGPRGQCTLPDSVIDDELPPVSLATFSDDGHLGEEEYPRLYTSPAFGCNQYVRKE
jgi:hypothetical protein